MSNYSDVWYEMNKGGIDREFEAQKCRELMVQKLSVEDMIRIMFEHHISNLSDDSIIKLSKHYVKM